MPETPERAQQELTLRIALGAPLMATKGYGAAEVEQCYTRAWELSQKVGESAQLFPVLSGLHRFYMLRTEYQTTRQLGEQLLSLAQRAQDSALLLEAHHALWLTLFWVGEFPRAQAHLEQGMAAWRAVGAELGRPYFLTLLAEACEKAGQAKEGLSALAEALALVHQTGERFYEAELHRLKGELLLQHAVAQQEEAETCFQQALDVARSQQAKSLELRATMSLSRLWQRQSKRDAARELLAPIYAWFTEGLDTTDLQDAKELLAALA